MDREYEPPLIVRRGAQYRMRLIACVPRTGVGRFYRSASIAGKRVRNWKTSGLFSDSLPPPPPPDDLAGLISTVLSLSRVSLTLLYLWRGVFISHSDQNVLSPGPHRPTTCGLEFIRGSSTENVSDISRKLYNINLGIRYVVMYGLPCVFLSHVREDTVTCCIYMEDKKQTFISLTPRGYLTLIISNPLSTSILCTFTLLRVRAFHEYINRENICICINKQNK